MAKDIVEKLEVTLISIWAFDNSLSKITCTYSFDVFHKLNMSGAELTKQQYPRYFSSIIENISILADDVYTNYQTKELVEDYFEPNNIKSLLDYVIYKDLRPQAVICCETVGTKRVWKTSDVEYLRALTVLAGSKLSF